MKFVFFKKSEKGITQKLVIKMLFISFFELFKKCYLKHDFMKCFCVFWKLHKKMNILKN